MRSVNHERIDMASWPERNVRRPGTVGFALGRRRSAVPSIEITHDGDAGGLRRNQHELDRARCNRVRELRARSHSAGLFGRSATVPVKGDSCEDTDANQPGRECGGRQALASVSRGA